MTTCFHCNRTIVLDGDVWADPAATGDDEVWRWTCDAHDTFVANHEPVPSCATCPAPAQTIIHCSEGSEPSCLDCAPATRIECITFEHLMNESKWEIMRHDDDDMARQRRIDEAGRYQL